MTKDEAIEAVSEVLYGYRINVTRAQAAELVEIGMQVAQQIEWTPQQRAVADAALLEAHLTYTSNITRNL